MRWRPAHEENSDVIQLYKGLPLLAPTAQNVLPRGVGTLNEYAPHTAHKTKQSGRVAVNTHI